MSVIYSMYWPIQFAKRFCSCQTEPPDSWGRLEPHHPLSQKKPSSNDFLKMKPVWTQTVAALFIRVYIHIADFFFPLRQILDSSSLPHHWAGFGGHHRGFLRCLYPHSGPLHHPEPCLELSTKDIIWHWQSEVKTKCLWGTVCGCINVRLCNVCSRPTYVTGVSGYKSWMSQFPVCWLLTPTSIRLECTPIR